MFLVPLQPLIKDLYVQQKYKISSYGSNPSPSGMAICGRKHRKWHHVYTIIWNFCLSIFQKRNDFAGIFKTSEAGFSGSQKLVGQNQESGSRTGAQTARILLLP